MMDERGIALRYLKAQKKRSILLAFGVTLAIALICAVFSMLNAMQMYTVIEASENVIWHIVVKKTSSEQAGQLAKRIDVAASGRSLEAGTAIINEDLSMGLTGCDADGANQLNLHIKNGKLPQSDNEIALEEWAARKINSKLAVGDTITVTLMDKTSKTYRISGILKDHNKNKSSNYIAGTITLNEAKRIMKTDKSDTLLQVKSGVDIEDFVNSLVKDQKISKDSILQHTTLLAAEGRSKNDSAKQIYIIGGFLALLVVFAAIIMIYNVFNISVAQRVRQFGMLRALGATPKQIRTLVKSEAVFVSLFGVLPGILCGIIATNVLLLFLRTIMPEYFSFYSGSIYISWISLVIGAVVGILATFISSLLPARKAGKISPIEAMTSVVRSGNIKKKTAWGILTKILPIEAAVSQRRLMFRKRSFIVTALSLSFGILLILSFSPLTELFKMGTSHNYDLGDMYIITADGSGIPDGLIDSIGKIDGVDRIYPKRMASVDATFEYKLLGDDYKDSIKDGSPFSLKADSNGFVKPPSKSTLIGISDSDLNNLKSKLVFGRIDPNQLNNENGVILILNMSTSACNSDLRPGQFIKVGPRKLKICGIVKPDALMYAANDKVFLGMYTTEKVFNSINSNKPSLVTLNLKRDADSDIVFSKLKELTKGNKNLKVYNQAEGQDVSKRIVLVVDVFVYGFITIIALIGILNIINTMSTSIITRTREIGLLRASGMTMGQVTAMVACESALYGILALIIGLAAGIPLHRQFFILLIKRNCGIPWSMPWYLVIISSIITVTAVMISIISPLSHIKKIEITQAVTVD